MIPIVGQSFAAPPGFSLKMFEDAHLMPSLKPLKDNVVGDVGSMLWVLMGSIGMVLLIACANVANLVLVRVEGRRQELAVRAALGARWSRIATELLIESMVLGLMGSLLGLGIAWGALRLLIKLAPRGLPRINEIGLDLPVLLFTFCIAILASLLFASIPIFKYAGTRLNTGLREGGRSLSQSRDQHRARSVLVVVQVALALVLLICSGLMARTFMAITRVQPGFSDPKTIQTFTLSIPKSEVADDQKVLQSYDEILRKLSAIPGVASVAISTGVPLDGNDANDPIFAEDKTYRPGELPTMRRFKWISPGYFHTIGTPLIAGRDITWPDLYNNVPVMMMSENLARELWQSAGNALGKRVRVGSTDDWREVVGVVSDVREDGMNKESPKMAYWPVMMKEVRRPGFTCFSGRGLCLAHPRAGTESLMKEVRQAIWSVDPNLPLSACGPEIITTALPWRVHPLRS